MLAGIVTATAVGIAGVQGPAIANNITSTCTHGVAQNNSGHRAVYYESSRTSSGQHVHKYRHDVDNWFDHHPERNC